MSPALPVRTDARLRVWLPPVLALLLLGASFWVLHRALQAIHYRDVLGALVALPVSHLSWAMLFCAANYLVLTAYDQLAFLYIGRRLARWRVGLTAFVSYAVANSVGFALLSGTAVRYRFYSRWGVPAADLSRIVVLNSITCWLGPLALAGWSLVLHSHIYLRGGLAQASAQWLGAACIATAAGYVILSVLRKAPLRVHGFEMSMPSGSIALGQLIVSMVDWALAAAVLYALLPEGGPPYGALLGAFVAAQVLGLISHAPGGIGVFDGVMLLLLGPYLPAGQIIASLLLYRLIYYLMPLTVGLMLLIADELHQRRAPLASLGRSLGAFSVQFAPRVLAVLTFMAGLLLFVAGATPAEPDRLHWLNRMLPPGLFEASHLIGILVGVGLMLLAQAVSRRVRLAWHLALATLAAGSLNALLKAFDW